MSHPPAGELIVRNGKHAGTRLPLRHPVTAIGAGSGCDIKLTAEGINPVHCVVAVTAAGPVLRAVGESVTVNGEERADAPLSDGDELKIGPCVLQLAWTAPSVPEPAPEDLPLAEELIEYEPAPPPEPVVVAPPEDHSDALRAQAAQLAAHFEERDRQIAEREQELTDARSAFRRERDADRQQIDALREQVAADRAEVERLKDDARALHKEAAKKRANVGRLTARFIGRAKRKWTAARKELDVESRALAEARGRFTAEAKRFEFARSEFYTSSAAENDRLRDAWAAVDAQQKRVTAEWAEANDYFVKQDAALDARAAELTAREKSLIDARSRQESETAALRAEAAGLDARAQHARTVITELEQKRDRLLAELVVPTKPTEQAVATDAKVSLARAADRDLTAWAAELDAREQLLNHDRARLAAAKESFDRSEADLADQRRVLAEQFIMLAGARSQWQQAEKRTVEEMEELARGLGLREQELDAREQRLIRADVRRRDDAFELWQFRLRLEGWQAKLTAFELAWHTDRAQAEENIARRTRELGYREGAVSEMLSRWEHAREQEQERLRGELQLWAADRERMLAAASDYERQRQDAIAELATHAARAQAAEEALAEDGTERQQRRVEVLRKRWGKAFERRAREIDDRRTVLASESAAIEERFRELHARLADVTDREAALNARLEKAEEVTLDWPMAIEEVPAEVAPPAELKTLREELDRLAAVLLDAEIPEVPDGELPWGADEPDRAEVLPFTPQQAKAA